MATPSINDLVRYIQRGLSGASWNANFQQIVNWFSNGTADVSFNSIEGSVTGDVTGNVVGDVTGDVYSNDGTTKILEKHIRNRPVNNVITFLYKQVNFELVVLTDASSPFFQTNLVLKN